MRGQLIPLQRDGGEDTHPRQKRRRPSGWGRNEDPSEISTALRRDDGEKGLGSQQNMTEDGDSFHVQITEPTHEMGVRSICEELGSEIQSTTPDAVNAARSLLSLHMPSHVEEEWGIRQPSIASLSSEELEEREDSPAPTRNSRFRQNQQLIEDLYMDKSTPINAAIGHIYQNLIQLGVLSSLQIHKCHNVRSIHRFLRHSGIKEKRLTFGDLKMEKLHRVRNWIVLVLHNDRKASVDKIFKEIKHHIPENITQGDLEAFLDKSGIRASLPKFPPYAALLMPLASEIRGKILRREGMHVVSDWLRKEKGFPSHIGVGVLYRFANSHLEINALKEAQQFKDHFREIEGLSKQHASVEEILQRLQKTNRVPAGVSTISLENFMIRRKIIPYLYDERGRQVFAPSPPSPLPLISHSQVGYDDEDADPTWNDLDEDEFENTEENNIEGDEGMGGNDLARHQTSIGVFPVPAEEGELDPFPNHGEILKLCEDPTKNFRKIYYNVPDASLPKESAEKRRTLTLYSRKYRLTEVRHAANEKLVMDLDPYEQMIRTRWEQNEKDGWLTCREAMADLDLPKHLTFDHVRAYMTLKGLRRGAPTQGGTTANAHLRPLKLALPHEQILTVYQRFADCDSDNIRYDLAFFELSYVLPSIWTLNMFRAYLWAYGLERPPFFENIRTIVERFDSLAATVRLETDALTSRERKIYQILVKEECLLSISYIHFHFWIRFTQIQKTTWGWRLSLSHNEVKRLFTEAVKDDVEICAELGDMPESQLNAYALKHDFYELRRNTLEGPKGEFESGDRHDLPKHLQKHAKPKCYHCSRKKVHCEWKTMTQCVECLSQRLICSGSGSGSFLQPRKPISKAEIGPFISKAKEESLTHKAISREVNGTISQPKERVRATISEVIYLSDSDDLDSVVGSRVKEENDAKSTVHAVGLSQNHPCNAISRREPRERADETNDVICISDSDDDDDVIGKVKEEREERFIPVEELQEEYEEARRRRDDAARRLRTMEKVDRMRAEAKELERLASEKTRKRKR